MEAEKNIVLIYECTPADIRIISYCCKQIGFTVFEADTRAHAEQLLNEREITCAFINVSMEKIKIGSEINVVITGDINVATTFKISNYKSACFIAKPLSISSIMFGLQKATGSYVEGNNFITHAVNISNTLNEIKYNLSALYKNKNTSLNFVDSLKAYCHNQCPLSKKEEEITGHTDEYEIVSYFSDKGTVYCNQKQACRLYNYGQFILNKLPDMNTKSAITIIDECYAAIDKKNIWAICSDLADSYDTFVNKLYETKREFCLTKCPDRVEGLDYKQGDNIHVDFTELASGVSVFCSEQLCSLDNFFELFRRKTT